MNPIQRLSELFSDLPGIGPRQAKRIVYHLLTQRKEHLASFSDAVARLQESIQVCSSCRRFFQKDAAGSALCSICRDEHRDRSLLMVVSRDVDLDNMEKTRSFPGLYFVLGGTVPILEKEPESRIRQSELVQTVSERASKGVLKELIFALNANPEGENTAEHLRHVLSAVIEKHSLKASVLGRGLSTGSELEYSDPETLKSALRNRA